MRKIAIQLGKSGSILGVLAGLIEMSIGAQILPWIGNKQNPVILGIITLVLSTVALLSVVSAHKLDKPTNDRKMAIVLGVLLPAAICFTTVGRLWYLPGSLLIVTCLLLAYEYWIGQSKGISPKIISRKTGTAQIIGVAGSVIILLSVFLAFINDKFGLFQAEMIVKTDLIRLKILPMDIVHLTKISGNITTVEYLEVSLVMIIYIFLIVGGAIALISALIQSRIFTGIGGILVFTGLLLFLFWIPGILARTGFTSVSSQDIIRSLGIGWVMALVGMSLIAITNIVQFRASKGKRV